MWALGSMIKACDIWGKQARIICLLRKALRLGQWDSYKAVGFLNHPSKIFFINIERSWEIFSTFWAETVKSSCRCFWTYFLATDSERKMCSWYFLCWSKCVIASGNISMFCKERVAALKKIFRKNACFWNLLKEKNVLLKDVEIEKKKRSFVLLELCPPKKYFEVKAV